MDILKIYEGMGVGGKSKPDALIPGQIGYQTSPDELNDVDSELKMGNTTSGCHGDPELGDWSVLQSHEGLAPTGSHPVSKHAIFSALPLFVAGMVSDCESGQVQPSFGN